MLSSPLPMILWWGEQHCQIYNDACRPLLGSHNPTGLGRPARERSSVLWQAAAPLVETLLAGRPLVSDQSRSVMVEMEVERPGGQGSPAPGEREEVHVVIACGAVPDPSAASGIGGVLATMHETTGQVLAERRMNLLSELGACIGAARTPTQACILAAEVFARHDRDLPVVLLYLFDPERKLARLAGAVGIELLGVGQIPDIIDPSEVRAHVHADKRTGISPWPFAQVMQRPTEHVVIDFGSQRQSPATGEMAPHSAMVVAIHDPTHAQRLAGHLRAPPVVGFLVAGLNPRLRCDAHHRAFLERVSMQLGAALAHARVCQERDDRAYARVLADWEPGRAVMHGLGGSTATDNQEPGGELSEPWAVQVGRSLSAAGAHLNMGDVYREAHQALRDSEERLRWAVENLSVERGKLEAVIRMLPIGIVITDQNAAVLSMNEAGLLLHGFRSLEEMLPAIENYREQFALKTLDGRLVPFSEWPAPKAMRGEFVNDLEVRLCNRLAGTESIVAYSVVPVRDQTGQPVLFVYVMQDVTGRRLAEQALQERERDLNRAQAVARTGSWRLDVRRHELKWSDETYRMFGVPKGTPLSYEFFLSKVPPEDRPRVDARWQAASRGEIGYEIEHRILVGEDEKWVCSRAELEFDAQGALLFGFGTVQDITEARHLQDALRQANERLEEADRRKNQFLAVLSHELRTPLAPIRNSLHIIEQAAPGSEQARRAKVVIDRQVAQLARLVEDLLDITRITRDKIQLQRHRLEIHALVRSVIEDYHSVFDKATVTLVVAPEQATEPVWVDADANRLAQVVGNLLQNAAKFTPPGGQVTVAVIPEEACGQVALRVVDSGVGMDPETLARVFLPFVQADTTLDRSRGGLGLGLALVRGLVELHGGEVTADSPGLGQGTEVMVRLPLAPGVSAGDPVGVSATPTKLARRVLVIEDNRDAAESLQEVLELDGHTVAVAHDGVDGIAQARTFNPDVVLCDIGLPGMDGYEVARTFRTDPVLQGIYIAALSGYALPDDLRRAAEAGFFRHLAKPLDPQLLRELLTTPDTSQAGTRLR